MTARKCTAFIAGSSALLAVFAAQGAANAATYSYTFLWASTITYADYGDVLKVSDIKADGMTAAGRWRYGDGSFYGTKGPWHTYYNGNGAGSTKTWNLDIDERQIEIQACTIDRDGDNELLCDVPHVVAG